MSSAYNVITGVKSLEFTGWEEFQSWKSAEEGRTNTFYIKVLARTNSKHMQMIGTHLLSSKQHLGKCWQKVRRTWTVHHFCC